MSRRRSSARIQDESAVYVPRSPVTSMKQTGNLTGNVRVARDHVADFCNLIQDWNKHMADGSKLISQIVNAISENIGRPRNSDMMANVGPHLQALTNICSALKIVVQLMDATKSSFFALQRLEESNRPVFLTWPIAKFAKVVDEMYTMYKKELEFKLKIKEELYFCEDTKLLTFYSVAWLQQPYIEKCCELYQRAMEKETGLAS